MVTPAVERGPETLALAGDGWRLGLLALLPSGVLSDGVAGCHRGTEGDVVLDHQFENLGRSAVAVLDGFGAGQDGAPHALGRARVDGHRDACVAGGLDRQFHLLEREGGMRTGERAPAVVAVELDPVGAVADLVAHHADQAIDAVGLFAALRHAPLGREALGAVGCRWPRWRA